MAINSKQIGFFSAVLIVVGGMNIVNFPINNIPLTQLTSHQIISMMTTVANIIIGIFIWMMDE